MTLFPFLPGIGKRAFFPIEGLSGVSYPLNATGLFSGSDTDSGGFFVISNLSLAEENTNFLQHMYRHMNFMKVTY